MASKQAQLTEKPAALSSSEDEEVSVEESESSEDSKSKSGTAVEKQSTPTVAPILEKKPVEEPETESESESESETGSDSDSASESAKTPPVATNTVPAKSSTVTQAGVSSEEAEKKKAKTEPTKSSRVTVLPETTILKRTLVGVSSEEPKKKKAKTSSTSTEVVPKEEVNKLPLFQRLFSKEDEVALLQGIIDFTATKGEGDPFEDSDAFCEFIKKLIKFDANRAQILNKVKRLQKKYENCVKNSLKKGKTEDDVTFSKKNDQNAFELSRKIWGKKGLVLTRTSKKKPETKKPETKSEIKTSGYKSQVSGEDLACFIKKEFLGSFGLNVSDFITGWDMVVDETTKLEIEEKMKRLKAMEVKLWLERIQFFADSAKTIVSAFASSSGN